MAIRRKTSEAAVLRALLETAEARKNLIITDLCYAGESAVRHARLNHTYKDQTGNLTSSIGYVVYEDDKPLKISEFEQITGTKTDKNGKKGSEVGKEYAGEVAKIAKQKHKLVVVAGMEYAEAVQAKGYEVLQGAIILVKNLLKRWYPDAKYEER